MVTSSHLWPQHLRRWLRCGTVGVVGLGRLFGDPSRVATSGAESKGRSMDEYDVTLHDGEQLEEIDLLAELMLLASAALTVTQAQIDAVLGIHVSPAELTA